MSLPRKYRMWRSALYVLLVVEQRVEKIREWMVQRLIESAPSFEEFSDFLQTYFAKRGLKVEVRMDYQGEPTTAPGTIH